MDWKRFIIRVADGGNPGTGDYREAVTELLMVVGSKAKVFRLSDGELRNHAMDLFAFLIQDGPEGGLAPFVHCANSIRRAEREQRRELSSAEARSILMNAAGNALPNYLASIGQLPAGYEIRRRLRRTVRSMKLPVEMGSKKTRGNTKMISFGFAEPPAMRDLRLAETVGKLGRRESSGSSAGVADRGIPTEGDLKEMLEDLRTLDGEAWYLVTDVVSLALGLFNLAPEPSKPTGFEFPAEEDATFLDQAKIEFVRSIGELDKGQAFPGGLHAKVLLRVMAPEILKHRVPASEVPKLRAERIDELAAAEGVSVQSLYTRRKAVIELAKIISVKVGFEGVIEIIKRLVLEYPQDFGDEPEMTL